MPELWDQFCYHFNIIFCGCPTHFSADWRGLGHFVAVLYTLLVLRYIWFSLILNQFLHSNFSSLLGGHYTDFGLLSHYTLCLSYLRLSLNFLYMLTVFSFRQVQRDFLVRGEYIFASLIITKHI